MGYQIKEITEQQAQIIIETTEPFGLFYHETSDGNYVAIDNENGNAYTEDFDDLHKLLKWLWGEVELEF